MKFREAKHCKVGDHVKVQRSYRDRVPEEMLDKVLTITDIWQYQFAFNDRSALKNKFTGTRDHFSYLFFKTHKLMKKPRYLK